MNRATMNPSEPDFSDPIVGHCLFTDGARRPVSKAWTVCSTSWKRASGLMGPGLTWTLAMTPRLRKKICECLGQPCARLPDLHSRHATASRRVPRRLLTAAAETRSADCWQPHSAQFFHKDQDQSWNPSGEPKMPASRSVAPAFSAFTHAISPP